MAFYEEEEEPHQPPPPPGHDDIHPGNNIVLIDSYPMKEVKIEVEMRRERPIQHADIQRLLPPGTPAALIASIVDVVNDYRNANLEDDKRVEYLDNRLHALNIRNPRALTNFIIQRVGSWESLDTIRNNQINRTPPGPDPFGIRRMTGTAAGVAPGYVGQPVGAPRNYIATYGRDRIDINSFTVFELKLPAGRYRFAAPEKVQMKDATTANNQTQSTNQDALFERWDIYRGTRWDTTGVPTGPIQENIRSRNDAEREIRSRRTGVQSEWNRVLDLRGIGEHGDENIKIVTIYKASA